ncbi:MAG: SDR family oxidoreductase [bacterium]
MQLDLGDKNAIVCGSSQGIGKAAAMELARLGASVCLVARNSEALQDVKQQLSANANQKHTMIAADFRDVDKLAEKMRKFVAENPPVHILVNNTGGPPNGPAIEADLEEYMMGFSNHLLCNQVLAQTLVPGMKREGYGRIINIISTSVKQPIKGLGVSNTIRGAVANWAKTLAAELGPYGITVNNVLPGATKTNRLASLIKSIADKTDSSIDVVAKNMKSMIPVGRFAKPEELAYAIAFLASPYASYINGINLPVDGGRTLCL